MLMLYMVLGVKAFASLLNLPLVFNPLLQGKSAGDTGHTAGITVEITGNISGTENRSSVCLSATSKEDTAGTTRKENVTKGTEHIEGNTVESTGHISSTTDRSSARLSSATEEDTVQSAVITRQSSSVVSC